MKLKRVAKIRDEWCDSKDGTISKESLEDLKKHLQSDNENNVYHAIDLATDIKLLHLAPLIAKNLTHESSAVREIAIGQLLGILKLPEYAEIGLKMAQEDESAGVRCLAGTHLGDVLDVVKNKELKKKIATYMYDVMKKSNYTDEVKQDIYQSVMAAMGISIIDRPETVGNPEYKKYIDHNLLNQFKDKYGL